MDETKFKCKSLHKLKGSVLLNWNPVKNLLPDKLHLTCDSVNCHFMTPYKSISVESDANATCMDDIVPEYNYENNNDSNFCAVVEVSKIYCKIRMILHSTAIIYIFGQNMFYKF